MYTGRKKMIIISIIVVLLVILSGGIAFAYLTTDLFKSNQTLFFKYIGQALDDIKYVENTQLSEIEKLKEEMPYKVTGNLKFEAGETNTDLNANVLSNLSLNIESKVDKSLEKTYTKANLLNNNQNLFTLEYANSNNIYALKSDEIVTAFLGIENDNLKVLAQKLGITDTSDIPDSIEQFNSDGIFTMTEEEKTHISQNYFPVLMQNINKENFTKEKNVIVNKNGVDYNSTGYRITLKDNELKQIEIALLETLKQDSITLNLLTTKAKLLGLSEKYTKINNLTEEIQKHINTINNENDVSDTNLSIIVYIDDNKVIKTEINFGEVLFTIYGETINNQTNRYLSIENIENNTKIEVQEIETRNNVESTYNFNINLGNDSEIDIYVTNNGSESENSLNTTCEISVSEGGLTSTINYVQEMIFEEEINDIIELNRNNCGVLNDYTTEQLQVLLQSLIQRIDSIIKQKKQVIGWQENVQMYDPDLQAIEENNNVQEEIL